jgi:hypothetical protein
VNCLRININFSFKIPSPDTKYIGRYFVFFSIPIGKYRDFSSVSVKTVSFHNLYTSLLTIVKTFDVTGVSY